MTKTKEEIKEEFIANTRDEYIKGTSIDKYCKIKYVQETNGTFRKLGLRIKVDSDIFDPKSNTYRGIIGLGRSMFLGEIKFFIKNLKQLPSEDIPLNSFEDIIKQIIDQIPSGEIIVLLPIKLKYDYLLKERKISYDYEKDSFIFKGKNNIAKVFSIHPDFIGDSIIIYVKDAINITFKGNTKEDRLRIEIFEPKHLFDKYEVLLEIILKQEMDSRKIKIFNVTNLE